MHLLLLLESPLSLQDWVLKLGPSIYMTVISKKKQRRFQISKCPAVDGLTSPPGTDQILKKEKSLAPPQLLL